MFTGHHIIASQGSFISIYFYNRSGKTIGIVQGNKTFTISSFKDIRLYTHRMIYGMYYGRLSVVFLTIYSELFEYGVILRFDIACEHDSMWFQWWHAFTKASNAPLKTRTKYRTLSIYKKSFYLIEIAVKESNVPKFHFFDIFLTTTMDLWFSTKLTITKMLLCFLNLGPLVISNHVGGIRVLF